MTSTRCRFEGPAEHPAAVRFNGSICRHWRRTGRAAQKYEFKFNRCGDEKQDPSMRFIRLGREGHGRQKKELIPQSDHRPGKTQRRKYVVEARELSSFYLIRKGDAEGAGP
jgi:hypothetical protein